MSPPEPANKENNGGNDEKTNNESNIQGSISRRDALKLAGVGGIIAGLGTSPVVANNHSDEVEITTLMDGDCVVETRKVPQEWYNHTQASRNAKNGLLRSLKNKSGIHAVSNGKRDLEIDGYKKHDITVTVSEDRDTDDIPEKVDGIPVTIERSSGFEPNSCDINPSYYDTQPDPIQGGIVWNSSDCDNPGSLCCRVKWYNNGGWDKYLMSARHIYFNGDSCDHTDPSGNKWYQYEKTHVGTVAKAWQKHDTVLLNLDSTSRDYGNTVINESDPVEGRVTKDGLDCFKSNNTDIEKRGIATGWSHGNITKSNYYAHWTCALNNNVYGCIRTDTANGAGDSGGPTYYKRDDGKIFIAAMHLGFDDNNNDESVGMSAAYLNNQEGIWFGPGKENGSC